MATRRRGCAPAVIFLLVLFVALAAVTPWALRTYGGERFDPQDCVASTVSFLAEPTEDGPVALTAHLTHEQADNAALIVAIAEQRGLPARAATIALATAIQESDLRNIDYGDRDSVGLFQQRTSQGWGSIAEIMDPYYSTNAFYDELVRVDGWQTMDVTQAAQAVQRSGFPEAYADHEADARVWASALTGYSGESVVTCRGGGPSTDAERGNADDVIARLERDFGGIGTVEVWQDDAFHDHVRFNLDNGQERFIGAIASWAVASSSEQGITSVTLCGSEWTSASGEWTQWWPLSCTLGLDIGL